MLEKSARRVQRGWPAAVQALAIAVALVLALLAGCGGQSACGDTQSDPDNCGSCGTACMPNQVCQQGTCVLNCMNGTTVCGSTCSDLQVDPKNCGGCGTACATGEVCTAGQCQTGCAGGTTMCGATCVDTRVDPGNCGGCGMACGASKRCVAGKCLNTCSPAQTVCTTDGGAVYCANTQQDNANCGGCGHACAPGDVCSSGKCANTCGSGQTFCADDGGGNGPYCANLETDNANCGSCGNACAADQSCENAKCVLDCGGVDGGAERLCSPEGGAPYCANTQTDQSNCGGCGIVCPPGQLCSAGTCACAPGLTQCPADGGVACVNTGTDAANCGGCGIPCPAQTPYCANGVCVNGCLNGGRNPVNACFSGTDPQTGAPWVVCNADCNQAWISCANANGGMYHATEICNSLGYGSFGQHGGNCGTACGYCDNGTCNATGMETFDTGGDCGNDAFGQILCITVMWQCLR